MASISEFWNMVTNTIVNSPRKQPSTVTIPHENADRKAQLEQPFEAGSDYFQVRVNQLFLKAERNWFTQIDPMVFVVSEFLYNRKEQSVPYIVGPSLMQQFGQQIPQGMIFSNEKVAGLHPYRGGPLVLSVVLCQVPVGSPAQKFLGVIERATKAFDLATVLGAYLKMGSVILDGVEALFGLEGTAPLVGLRTTFDPQAGDLFTPNYFALIDAESVNPQDLYVRDSQLLRGDSMDTAIPYHGADFVLYSIMRAPDRKRDDIEQLPFYELWERAVSEATLLKEGSWDNAKGHLITLWNALTLSPDLTRQQANDLISEYGPLLKSIYEGAIKISHLSDAERSPQLDELDDVRRMANSILQS